MKNSLFALLHALGVVRIAAWCNRKRVMILCYHGVTEREPRGAPDPDGVHVGRERFEAHLDYLRRCYNVISLTQYLEARRARHPLPHNSVVITFDDGYRNFLTSALPALSARGMHATVFLVTACVRDTDDADAPRRWRPCDDRLLLSWAEARELEAGGRVEFGSHTCTHPDLSSLTPEEAERELCCSRRALDANLRRVVRAFAYPFGKHSPDLARQAQAAGYACALTDRGGGNDDGSDLFTLRRELIGAGDDVAAFAARVSGLRWWLYTAGAVSVWQAIEGAIAVGVSWLC